MSYRKLRIAWSVAWGVVAVLLCVLWVRSYYGYDTFTGHNGWGVLADSCNGRFGIALFQRGDLQHPMTNGISFEAIPGTDDWWPKGTFGFGTKIGDCDLPFHFAPYWFPFSFAATFAAAPWLRWHFSLRTLLIAVTLVALLLGLVVWAMR